MTQITLKRQAREFAAKHGISYSLALKAVDEPLHRLRDALYNRSKIARPGFRLIDSEEDLLEPLAPEEEDSIFADLSRKMRGIDVKLFVSSARSKSAFISDLSRRMDILTRSRAGDIWQHRMLYRAGLVEENLEPVPHYYHFYKDVERTLVSWKGANLGIIEVAVLQERFDPRLIDGFAVDTPDHQRGSRRLKKISHGDLLDLFDPTGAERKRIESWDPAEHRAPSFPQITPALVLIDGEIFLSIEGFMAGMEERGYPVMGLDTDGAALLVDASKDPNDYSVLMAATETARELGIDPDAAIEWAGLQKGVSAAQSTMNAAIYRCSKCGKQDIYETMVEHPYYGHGDTVEREDLPGWIRRA